MTLSVIGAGLGRTGTLSLKAALEHLGFGPCYHMAELFLHMEHVPLWIRAAEGEDVWDELFDGYVGTVDYPGCSFWRELAAKYPSAKVILSVRDANKWFELDPRDDLFATDGGDAAIVAAQRVLPEDRLARFQHRSARSQSNGSGIPGAQCRGHAVGAEGSAPGVRSHGRLAAALQLPGRAGARRALSSRQQPGGIRRRACPHQTCRARSTWPNSGRRSRSG